MYRISQVLMSFALCSVDATSLTSRVLADVPLGMLSGMVVRVFADSVQRLLGCFFWFVKTWSNSPQTLRDWMDEYDFFHGKWWWW